MFPPGPEDFPWPAALHLDERHDLEDFVPSAAAEDVAKADRRLQRWLAQAPFEQGRYRRLRFSLLGDNQRLSSLLSTPRRLLGAPSWTAELQRIYRPQGESSRPVASSEAPRLHAGGFSIWLLPLLNDAARRWQSAFETIEGAHTAFSSDRVLDAALGILHRHLRGLATPSLVLELRIAGLENKLQGETPEQRFHSFAGGLENSAEAWRILTQYPVLARRLIEDRDRIFNALHEMLSRLGHDHRALTRLSDGDLGPLVEIEKAAGDPHRGGRQVRVLRFASGRRWVYKPRPPAVEVAFQELLGWGQDHIPDLPRPTRWLAHHDYGWMEWLQPKSCDERHQVELFYRRQGSLLALLHLLGATDLHLENLMAEGSQPLVIDLETLLHPQFQTSQQSTGEVEPLDDTVLRVGLLPNRLIGSAGDKALDASGLGAEVGQETPAGGLRPQAAGTDQMRLVPAEGRILATPGRPTLRGKSVEPGEFAHCIEQGFRHARQALASVRPLLNLDEGPLAAFRGLPTRAVLRPTQTYACLLSTAAHPRRLGDAVDQDRHFDHLWLGVKSNPGMAAVIPAECRDLRQGDIPYFTAGSDSRSLVDSQGQNLGQFFIESGFDGLRRRLDQLNDDETERQAALIRQSFELKAAERGERRRLKSVLRPIEPAASKEHYLDAAFKAADRLRDLAFVGAGGARWWVPRRLAPRKWTLAEAGPDLYYGLSGIALFLQSLYSVAGRRQDGELADAAYVALARQLRREKSHLEFLGLRQAGGFSGWGGVLHTLMRLADLQGQSAPLQLAVDLLNRVSEYLLDDTCHDLMAGTAGAAATLVDLALRAPDSQAAALAEHCGDILLRQAQAQKVGLGWPAVGEGGADNAAQGPALAGFSHGASGAAWALWQVCRLPQLTAAKRQRFIAGAEAALGYENSLFDAAEGNWRDLRPRPDSSDAHFLCAWCHGAPGIGLARLAIAHSWNQAQESAAGRLHAEPTGQRLELLGRDLKHAVDHTLKQGFGLNHSLCHGDLGNLDLLIEAAASMPEDHLDFEPLQRRLTDLGAGVLGSVKRQGFLFGSPGGTEPPGLMLGLAGIGFGFLRLADPRIPSVLRLAHGSPTVAKSSLFRSLWAGITLEPRADSPESLHWRSHEKN